MFRLSFVNIKEFIYLIKNHQSSHNCMLPSTPLYYWTLQHNTIFPILHRNLYIYHHWNTTYAFRRVCILITECLLKLHYTQKLRRDAQRQNYDTFSHAAWSRHIMNTVLKYCVGKGEVHPTAYPFRYRWEAEVYLQPIRRSALGGDRSSISCSGLPNTGKDKVPIVQQAGLELGPVLKAWKM